MRAIVKKRNIVASASRRREPSYFAIFCIIVLLNIFWGPLLMVPKKTFAATYTNSYIPELYDAYNSSSNSGYGSVLTYNAAVKNLQTATITNYYTKGGADYNTKYTDAFQFQFVSSNAFDQHCWKMTSSTDFRTVTGNFYFCLIGAASGSDQYGIFAPTDQATAQQTWNVKDQSGQWYGSLKYSVLFKKYVTDAGITGSEADYLTYVANNSIDFKDGAQTSECLKMKTAGGTYTDVQYGECFFPTGGTFSDEKIDMSNGAPTISIPGKDNRPDIIFKLTQVMRSFGIGGVGGRTDDYFYFVATNPSYPNLSIRLTSCGSPSKDPRVMDPHLIENLNDDVDINGSILGAKRPDVTIDDDTYKTFMEKVYGPGALDITLTNNGCSSASFNTSQMSTWGVTVTTRHDDAGASGGDECGSATSIGGAILVGFCNITVMFRDWSLSLLCFAQGKLMDVLGQAGITSSTSGVCSDTRNQPDSTMKNIFK